MSGEDDQLKIITNLEKINEILDLCIDRGLYEYLEPTGHDSVFKISEEAHELYNKMFNDTINGNSDNSLRLFESLSVTSINFPRGHISLLRHNLEHNFASPDLEPKQLNIYWSNLFWSKIIRSKLLKRNEDKWLANLDDLLLCLESYLPKKSDINGCIKTDKDAAKRKIWKNWHITLFNYLMELSAIAEGEASLGYAEHARKIIGKVYPPGHKSRKNYDRWIGYNKGLAFQHIGRNKKAIVEFNRVIFSFFAGEGYNKRKANHNNPEYVIEFILNIYPSILQRASINNKMQLSYHALQTLVDHNAKRLMKALKGRDSKDILGKASINLSDRASLLEIEALLQQHSTEEANEKIRKLCKDVFPLNSDYVSSYGLPQKDENCSPIQIQLVEQSIDMYLESLRKTSELAKRSYNIDHICSASLKLPLDLTGIVTIINTIREKYWPWVKNNSIDRKVFFSRVGLALSYATELYDTLCNCRAQLTNPNKDAKRKDIRNKSIMGSPELYDDIICASTQLYYSISDKLPVNIRNRKDDDRIKFEEFRSDDLPDYVAGLTSYYKSISAIVTAKTKIHRELIEHISTILGVSGTSEIISLLHEHQNQFLEALDEYDKEFGENLHIDRITRYNQRLIWDKKESKKCGDQDCFGGFSCLPDQELTNMAFSGLLACVPNNVSEEEIAINSPPDCKDYENIMSQVEDHILEHLKGITRPEPKRNAIRFMGLQRWNSLTPAQGKSVGGGYFVYRTNSDGVIDLGLALDPGFDFVRNFFRMGFSLRDIDIILISHSHPDHIWDFESIIQLLKELHDKTGIYHIVNVVLTLGAYDRLRRVINNQALRAYIHPLVIDIRKEIDKDYFEKLTEGFNQPSSDASLTRCFRFHDVGSKESARNKKLAKQWVPIVPNRNHKYNYLEIWPTRAYHDDYSELSDCFGFLMKMPGRNSRRLGISFGYTGDTKWVDDNLYHSEEIKEIAGQYKDCNVVLMHMGSLIDHKDKRGKKGNRFKDYSSLEPCDSLIRKSNHPYLMGMMRFISKMRSQQQATPKLILIGEFGEELKGGIRADLIRRFKEGLAPEWPIIPVDVGLDVLMCDLDGSKGNIDPGNNEFKFLCVLCDHYRDVDQIDYIPHGQDEAIFSVCKTCKKAVPLDVRQIILQNLYEKGRQLRTV